MYPQRRDRLLRFLDEHELDALVLRRAPNVAWAAEGARTHIDVSADLGVAWLVVSRDGTRVVTSRIEAERLRAEELPDPAYEWTVLDWNAPSIAFYRSLGALPMEEWTTQRLVGGDLEALARR